MSESSKKPSNTTRKKTKVVGHQEYINKSTGQLETMQVINIEDRDANFTKIWLGHIVEALDVVGNQKLKVATFIMSNLNNDNLFLMTNREIQKKTGIALSTISITMKALQEADFLRKVRSGHYAINPEIMFKGGTNKRMSVLLQYTQIEQTEQKKDDESSEDSAPHLQIVK